MGGGGGGKAVFYWRNSIKGWAHQFEELELERWIVAHKPKNMTNILQHSLLINLFLRAFDQIDYKKRPTDAHTHSSSFLSVYQSNQSVREREPRWWCDEYTGTLVTHCPRYHSYTGTTEPTHTNTSTHNLTHAEKEGRAKNILVKSFPLLWFFVCCCLPAYLLTYNWSINRAYTDTQAEQPQQHWAIRIAYEYFA